VLLFTMVCVAVIAYTKPFQTFYVNVLEMFTHVTVLLLFIIASTNRFEVCVLVCITKIHTVQHVQDPVFKTESNIKESLVDDCGNVDILSEHAAMLVPFYCLPLLVFAVLIFKKIFDKIHSRFRGKRSVVELMSDGLTCILFHRSYKKFSNADHADSFDSFTSNQPVNVLSSYMEFNDDNQLVLISKRTE